MTIYRFRPINSILSEEDLKGENLNNKKSYDELRAQEVYHSHLHLLNDPMEGYMDIVWQGDNVVWKNLIKHYVICLEHVINLSFLLSKEDILKSSNIPIFKKYSDLPTKEYKSLIDEVCSKFFSNRKIIKFIKIVSEEHFPLRRDEILLYITNLHFCIIDIVWSVYYKKGLASKKLQIPKMNLKFFSDENLEILSQFKRSDHKEIPEFLSSVSNRYFEQIKLITRYNNKEDNKNKAFLLFDFPSLYLKETERLLYPDFTVACFSDNHDNSSMWSHYAQNHEGVCLQFKTKNKDQTLFFGNRPIYKIRYQKKFPEIDFFQSLGNLPMPHLYKEWLCDESNNISGSAKFLNAKNENKWREKYWKLGYKFITTKSNDWKYDKELRSIIYSTIGERKKSIKYYFKDLEGIIFGIKTKNEHKIKIIKIIEEKCKIHRRNDFKFFQSEYCPKDGKIAKKELGFLKFSS